jgi:hypothetical protein
MTWKAGKQAVYLYICGCGLLIKSMASGVFGSTSPDGVVD